MDEETERAIEEAMSIIQPGTPMENQGQPEEEQPEQSASSLEEALPAWQPELENETGSRKKKTGRSRFLVMAGLAAGIVVLTVTILLAVVPLLSPSAMVTIIPAQASVSTTATVQVQGRNMPTVTLSQVRTVPATGTGHQDAQAAQGSVTFYNGYTQAQAIPAGTLLQTGSGIQIVTDTSAYVPAAEPPTQGQATVAAHALQTGPAGNIAAGSIYGPCCQAYILVQNTASFMGGQDARNFQMVTQRDLDDASTSLKGMLMQSANATFQAQLQQGEALTPPRCTVTTASDHQAGQEGTQVQVTVTASCSAQAYSAQAVQTQALQHLTTAARQQLGEGYVPVDPRITVLDTSGSGNQAILSIKAIGTATYQFSSQQLQAIKQTIAGQSKDEATAWLVRQRGIKAVSIAIDGLSSILPQNASAIQCTLLYMA